MWLSSITYPWRCRHTLSRRVGRLKAAPTGDGACLAEARPLQRAKAGNGCTKMRLGRIPELDDERMTLEGLLHDPSLHTFSAPVNQPHFAEACFMRRGHVLGDDRRNVARCEGVEIERVFDRNSQQGFLEVES